MKRVIAAFMAAFIMLGCFIHKVYALPSVIETNQYYRDTVLKNKTDRFESLLDVYKSNNQGAMVLHTYMDYLVAIMGNPYYSADNEEEMEDKVIEVLSEMYKSLSASNLSFTSSLEHYVDAIQQRVDELQAAYDSLGFWEKVGQFFVSLGRWCCGLVWTSNNEERELKTALEYYTSLIDQVDSEMLSAVSKLGGLCEKEAMDYCGEEPCRFADPDAVNQDYCEYHTLVYLMPHGTSDQVGKVCNYNGEFVLYIEGLHRVVFAAPVQTETKVDGRPDIAIKLGKELRIYGNILMYGGEQYVIMEYGSYTLPTWASESLLSGEVKAFTNLDRELTGVEYDSFPILDAISLFRISPITLSPYANYFIDVTECRIYNNTVEYLVDGGAHVTFNAGTMEYVFSSDSDIDRAYREGEPNHVH